MKAFSVERLTHHGTHFHFEDVPIELKPVQLPHPPLWLGMGNPDHTRHAAQNKINMVCNGTTAQVRLAITIGTQRGMPATDHAAPACTLSLPAGPRLVPSPTGAPYAVARPAGGRYGQIPDHPL